MTYQVVKSYGHNEGCSCTYRQHRTDSHCRYIHGYALGVEITFECETLDARNWCFDFGAMKPVKEWLKDTFDHKTLVATDDPEFDYLIEMHHRGLQDVVQVPATGCEKFAYMIFAYVDAFLMGTSAWPRVQLISVKVAEHVGNSALVIRRSP